ncbi:ABC1 kinase family protein [Luteipulveratus mongoliensis]|uniref:Protein kinase domain-containing protein n=1 Tax=Luteipulveratus mongoliensis TaxID=571913 RepID=A0A0K1JKD1_9MICO|nr:AarF/UbiB family protein [Luteipulveratus mongoliensis]AKU17035.1 hypothetical protein VV02_16150 [Luteipulveratus mongoliensis]
MGLLVGLASLVNAVIIAFIARRLLGAPVGWPRAILLSLMVNASVPSLLDWASGPLSLQRNPAQNTVEAAQTALVSGLLISWVIVAEVALLVILEALVPTGSLPNPIDWVRGLPARWRRTRRYVQIVRIATRHGLSRYFRRGRTSESPGSDTARALREALTEGGVTFVKLGQMLSTRPDVLPAAFVRELSRLHSDVPPQPWSVVQQTLDTELGRPHGEVFSEIDQTPFASASVGQVHRARLADGREVVVKVQRSDARAQVTADLDIVLRLARWLDRRTEWARRVGARDLAHGFAESLDEELDYTAELSNVYALQAALDAAGDTRVRVPQTYPAWCSERLLVMERMPGLPLSSAADLLATFSDQTRRDLAEHLLGSVLDQVISSGVFHADLHAGNVFIDEQERLGLLDLGSVGRLDRGARQSLALLLLAVDRQDGAAATHALVDLLDRGEHLDERRLERDVSALIMRYAVGAAPGRSSQMFVAMLRVVLAHDLSVPPQVAAAFRALGALEGTLTLLSPDVDMVQVARARGRSLLQQQLSPQGLREHLQDQMVAMLPVLQRLPARLAKVTEDLEAGRLAISVRTFETPRERRFVRGLAQQVIVSVLAAACALGGILMVIAETGPMMTTTLRLYAFLGFVLLLFGFVLGARALVLVFRHAREHALDSP